MSNYYNKDALKNSLAPEQVFDLLEEWGGQPTWENNNCIVCDTICHNSPGEGSHKLYYYFNTHLFHCFTDCLDSTFDIFELCIKIVKNQRDLKWELYEAMSYIASYFGIEGERFPKEEQEQELEDWEVFKRHDFQVPQVLQIPVLPEYNPLILTRFSYPRIKRWEQEGIKAEISRTNLIGYYPGNDQITIPHFDINNRLIGIRGRFLSEELANRYGKYKPLLVNKTLYTHPLSMNLYNLNNSKNNIKRSKVAIVLESEKATMQYQSYYGKENDISVACCGSSLSGYQVNLLKTLGVNEIILAFDRQFQEIGDEEFKRLKAKLINLRNRFKNTVKITIIFDKNMITSYKASPLDEGKEKFEQLLKERLIFE